jgi:hypothetical protein
VERHLTEFPNRWTNLEMAVASSKIRTGRATTYVGRDTLLKLWQGCGKNPDFVAKTDIIDKFPLSEINNLRVINTGRVYPAYRPARHSLRLGGNAARPSGFLDLESLLLDAGP